MIQGKGSSYRHLAEEPGNHLVGRHHLELRQLMHLWIGPASVYHRILWRWVPKVRPRSKLWIELKQPLCFTPRPHF